MQYFASLNPKRPKAWEWVRDKGREITMEPVESWPSPFSRYFREAWRLRLYPGEVVEWPDPETLPVVNMTRTRAGRRSGGRA